MNASALSYPVIPDERSDDLHGLEEAPDAQLVIFMAGNQFMAMPELMTAFRRDHPDIDSIYYETLPPKMELRQILAGGALFRGRLIDTAADVYTSVSSQAVVALAEKGMVDKAACFVYLHNRIALMVPTGNPRGIEQVTDLARDGVRISQPSLAHEAGGEELERRIMIDKLGGGDTLLTTVHHRETPQRLMRGQVDVGPVWATEITHARRSGLPLEGIEVGVNLDQHDRVRYFACPLNNGRNPENGMKFLAFLGSDKARRIYSSFGFMPPGG